MARFRVLASELKQAFNPLDGVTWACDPISEDEVREAHAQGRKREESWNEVKAILPPTEHRIFHIERIAYLLDQAPSAEEKIALALSPDRNWIVDGNHRVAAAFVRGDNTFELIVVDAGDGSIKRLLPSAVEV